MLKFKCGKCEKIHSDSGITLMISGQRVCKKCYLEERAKNGTK